MTLILVLLSLATAGPLDEHAGQQHTDRAKVTKQTCEAAYIERCQEGD